MDMIQSGWLLIVNVSCYLEYKYLHKNDILLVLEVEPTHSAAVVWRRKVVMVHNGSKFECILTKIKHLMRSGEISILQIPEDHGTMES